MIGDTIVALLTPRTTSALASFAVLGPNSKSIIDALFEQCRGGRLESRRPNYGWFGHAVRDDVVVAIDDQADEDCIEVICHGGLAMTQRLVGEVVDHGAVLVDWRRFERRRGRSEFQCDAIDALSRALTSKTASILLDQLNGALDRALLAADSNPAVAAEVLENADVGNLLIGPAQVVLFGLPNAGKSSLFNALVGYSRVITNPIAGTTRDVVSEMIALDGWPIELIDGAGIRGDASPLEAEGIKRITSVLKGCDVSILVADANDDRSAIGDLAHRFTPNIVVDNKIDLTEGRASVEGRLKVSALTGQGVEELRNRIVERIVPRAPLVGAAVPFRETHREIFAGLMRTGASISPR